MSVDRDRRSGRFLLTGSANLLLLPTVSESLAGRMEIVRLHPLTEAEKERQPGRFLAHLLASTFRPQERPGQPEPQDLARRLVQGGYPEARRRDAARLRKWHRAYLEALIERDARDVSNLADLAGTGYQGGVILHAGTSTLPTADPRVLAVPISKLWTS